MLIPVAFPASLGRASVLYVLAMSRYLARYLGALLL
jgi:hypothetical protein